MRTRTNGPVQENDRERYDELRRRAAELDAELCQARERLHEAQRAVHNAGQVLAIARIERHVAAIEVAELAERLERLQSQFESADDAPVALVIPASAGMTARTGAHARVAG
jgi:hypothetical protein